MSSNALSEHLLDCLKRVAAALRDAEVPYALGGGLSAWARGGPPSENDVDLLIREEDWERAHRALEALGLRTEVPPEGWLVKAFEDDILIDLIYRPSGLVIDDEFLARCDELSVQAVWMRVMPLDDLLVSKLLSLTEHHLDFGRALEISRALREQINWSEVRRRTEHSPFARAFLNLVVDLGIATTEEASVVPGQEPSRKAMAGGT